MTVQQDKPGRGCLFYTGIAMAISIVILIIASYLGYRYAKGLVMEFTASAPVEIPDARISTAQLNDASNRLANFLHAVEHGNATEPLVLGANEANGLITLHSNLLTVRGRIHFELDGTNAMGQFSVPAEDLGFKPLQGRFVNASGPFAVGFSNGVLNVNAQALEVDGKPFPDTFMGRVRPQNFAYKLNSDPRGKIILTNIHDVLVTNGTLLILPKRVPSVEIMN